MPTADPYLREQMKNHFGDDTDLAGPERHLLASCFWIVGGDIRPPYAGYAPTALEQDCIEFLVQEWDYSYTNAPFENRSAR